MQLSHLLYYQALLFQFLLVRIYFIFQVEVVPVVLKPGILQISQAAFQSSAERTLNMMHVLKSCYLLCSVPVKTASCPKEFPTAA